MIDMVANEIEESAKAVKATAETAGKVVDAGRELGGFLSRIFGGPMEQVSGILEDALRFRRQLRLLRLQKRYEQIRSELKVTTEPKPVDMKLGVPLIAAATLEEDDRLQDMYARLLVTATDPKSTIKAQRAFVTILEDLGPLEAVLLDRIYNAREEAGDIIATARLPEGYVLGGDQTYPSPSPEVQLALWNLARLGCVSPGGTWGGGASVSAVTLTALGHALVETCTANAGKSAAEEPKPSNWTAQAYSTAAGITYALQWRVLSRWDLKSARAAAFRAAHPSFRPLGDFIEEATEIVHPAKQPAHKWPVYGVNNKEGIVFSHFQLGETFNSTYKRIKKDWFFHNPTRANVGSLGRVPDVPSDAITSPEYQVWRIKQGLLPEFVEILIRLPFLLDLIDCHRVGAVKERLFVENLCEIPIPVLSKSQHSSDASGQTSNPNRWINPSSLAQPETARRTYSASRPGCVDPSRLTHTASICVRPRMMRSKV
jgi:Abortive infection alpha